MATKVSEIIDIPDNDDDEISIIYATPFRATRSRPRRHRRVFDSSHLDGDDDVKLLHSFPNYTRRRFLRGECSYSETAINSNQKKNSTKSSAPSTFICKICTDEKPNREILRVMGCDHIYCSDCMGKYVAARLRDGVASIDCPVSGCRGFLEPHHCRSILPGPVFDRWGDALCEAVILASEKFYCPFEGCAALLLVDETRRGRNEVVVQSECPDCHRLFCAQCKVPWHSGIACDEFQKLNEDGREEQRGYNANVNRGKCKVSSLRVLR